MLKQTFLNILKLKNNTKYVYFGIGIELGVSSLLLVRVALRWMLLNFKIKKIPTKFIKKINQFMFIC